MSNQIWYISSISHYLHFLQYLQAADGPEGSSWSTSISSPKMSAILIPIYIIDCILGLSFEHDFIFFFSFLWEPSLHIWICMISPFISNTVNLLILWKIEKIWCSVNIFDNDTFAITSIFFLVNKFTESKIELLVPGLIFSRLAQHRISSREVIFYLNNDY